LLIAGTFSSSPLSKECAGKDIKYSYIRSIIVKKLITMKKPAGIRNKSYLEVPQRLNAGDLTFAYLVGLIEGDGWFSISKKGKYLMYEFGIEVALRDVQLIYKIKNLLGVGTVCFRNKESKNNTVLFRVRNKSHLINVILPILDKYPFFSNKQYDYLRFREALLNEFKYYEELDTNYIRPNISLNSVNFIINAPYFSAWLVGLIEAEGCFSIYKPTKDSSLVASFDISQTDGENLILAIREYLYLSSNVYKDQTNSFKIKISSVRSVENVIKFMKKAPVKLKGNKKLQYLLWLKELRKITRYTKKINIPDIY
jgi:LAGLIDADG endonuclease